MAIGEIGELGIGSGAESSRTEQNNKNKNKNKGKMRYHHKGWLSHIMLRTLLGLGLFVILLYNALFIRSPPAVPFPLRVSGVRVRHAAVNCHKLSSQCWSMLKWISTLLCPLDSTLCHPSPAGVEGAAALLKVLPTPIIKLVIVWTSSSLTRISSLNSVPILLHTSATPCSLFSHCPLPPHTPVPQQ